MPMVMLAQKIAAMMLVNVAAESVILLSFGWLMFDASHIA